MDHQDWEPVVLKKKTTKTKAETTQIAIQPNKQNPDRVKINDEDDMPQVKTYGKEYGISVSKARVEKKLSQQQLANQINEKVDVVKSIENGKGTYNPNVAQKIFRILKVKRNK